VRARWLVLAIGLFAVGTTAASEQVHTVTAGESAGSLAKKYYGSRELGELLLRYNGKPGKMVHPGERLTIPFCEVYRARPGDTWSALAKRRLGRAKAGPVLAELNGYAGGEPLPVGTRIVFPVVLRHSLARGETLSSLAERFYGDPQKAATLQEFSQLDDVKRLAVGTPLEIPLVTFIRVEAPPGRNEPKPALAAPAPAAIPETPVVVEAAPPPPPPDRRKFESPLAEAGRTFADGEYGHARSMLEGIREIVAREGGDADRQEWSRLMAFVYIALDRNDDACAAYRSGGPQAGTPGFDPDLISPRIRTVLSKCPVAGPGVERLDNSEAPSQISLHADTQR
jgi:LysM repeat protein